MKKLLLTVVFLFAVLSAAQAQPKAVGVKLGPVAEISYQHYVGNSFFEVDFGADFMKEVGVRGDFSWNWVFARPGWTSGDWAWYAGPVVSTGYVNDKLIQTYEEKTYKSWDMGFMAGIGLQVGCEYTFWFPLQLSLSLRPLMGMHVIDGAHLTYDENDPIYLTPANNIEGVKTYWYRYGLAGFIPTLGVRYSF